MAIEPGAAPELAAVAQDDGKLYLLTRVNPAVTVPAGRTIKDCPAIQDDVRPGGVVDQRDVIGEDLRPRSASAS